MGVASSEDRRSCSEELAFFVGVTRTCGSCETTKYFFSFSTLVNYHRSKTYIVVILHIYIHTI